MFNLGLEQLIENCKKQNTKAQGELYKLFSSKLFAICLKYSRNRMEAEDNLQDAFLIIFNKIEQFKNKGSFEGWLKRITVNTVLQRYRNEKVFELIKENHICIAEDTNKDGDGFYINTKEKNPRVIYIYHDCGNNASELIKNGQIISESFSDFLKLIRPPEFADKWLNENEHLWK